MSAATPARQLTAPTVPVWPFWARLLHRDYVGMEAGERKRAFCARSGFQVDHLRKMCRPHSGTETGERDPLTRLHVGLMDLQDVFPGSRADIFRLVSWLPNQFFLDVVPRRALFGTEYVQDAAARLGREVSELIAKLLEALSPSSRGGAELTARECHELLPEVDDALQWLHDVRLRLEQKIAEAA